MLDPQWSGSLQVGVIGFPPDRLSFPGTATAIKKSAIVLQGHAVFACGIKVSLWFFFLFCFVTLEKHANMGVNREKRSRRRERHNFDLGGISFLLAG